MAATAGEEGGVTLVLHPAAAASIDSQSAARRYAPERTEKLEREEKGNLYVGPIYILFVLLTDTWVPLYWFLFKCHIDAT